VGWDKITRPKSLGGHGVRVAHNDNIVLLGKLVWAIHTNAKKIWVKLLSNKYLGNSSVLDVPKKNDSTTWNSILKVMSVLRDGFVFRLSNSTTSFWYSSWTTLGTFASIFSSVDIHDIFLCIHDLIMDGNWNFNPLYTILLNNIQNHVKSRPSGLRNDVPDCITWVDHMDGIYTAIYGYSWLLTTHFEDHRDEDVSWN